MLPQVAASQRFASAEAQLTLPKWDFGRLEDRGPAMKAARQHMHTLKSHHINTLREGTLLGTLPRGSSRHATMVRGIYTQNCPSCMQCSRGVMLHTSAKHIPLLIIY